MEATTSAEPFLRGLAAGLPGNFARRRLLVAVSGGRDSVALLHGLHELGARKLTVVHLDHRLRGAASRADARFVERLAGKLEFRCVLGRADVKEYAGERGVSIEVAARELRRAFFAGVARRERCRDVVLAHHAEDQVETCLFNFLRGSGAAGLAGMRSESVQKVGATTLRLLRPMLGTRREAIDGYLTVRKIRWREDASNVSAVHARNRLRMRILPMLMEEFGPAFPDAILRAAAILAAEEDWMRAEAGRGDVGLELCVRELAAAPLAMRRRVVRNWLERMEIPEPGFAETERVLALLDARTGPAKINLPGDCHARRRQGKIFLERP